MWSWAAKRTLSMAQELYDTHKLTTYPRTDSRHLPEDMMEAISKTIRQLGAQDGLNPHSQRLIDNGLKNVKRNFDNSKVSDHFAIIPTGKIPPANLSSDASKLYDLINLNTLVFIEVPGIDSLKNGRRHSDILGDIQIAHKYYFSKEVLKNILENHGFSVIDSDSQIKIIMKKKKNFKKNLKNNFLNTCFNLILAEIRMNLSFYKKKFF